MAIAEGVGTSLRFKIYASGAITPTSKPAIASDPNSSGGRLLRRTATTLNLRKDGYASTEILTSRLVEDFRHGVRRVEGSIDSELTPNNFWRFYEAAFRAGVSAAITLGNAEFTSVTSDAATSSFTFAGGNPVTSNIRVGDVVRFTNLATTANNNRNFLILGFSGTSNRTVTVSPAPVTDAVADSSFSITRPGQSLQPAVINHLQRKFLLEAYSDDLDISRIFEECRVTGFRISLPPTGMATTSVNFLGRDMQILTGASAPFFTAPTSGSSVGPLAAVNGQLRVGGVPVGIVTGLELAYEISSEAPAVVGQNIVADILLGTARVTGTLTALFDDVTLLNLFLDEQTAEILVLLEAGTTQPAPAMTILLPRVKFNTGDVEVRGEGAQTISMAFEALRVISPPPGVGGSVMYMHDTEGT